MRTTPGDSHKVVQTVPGLSQVLSKRQPCHSLYRLRPLASQLLMHSPLLPASFSWVFVEEPLRISQGLSSTQPAGPMPWTTVRTAQPAQPYMASLLLQVSKPPQQECIDPQGFFSSPTSLHSAWLETLPGESSGHRARDGSWWQ